MFIIFILKLENSSKRISCYFLSNFRRKTKQKPRKLSLHDLGFQLKLTKLKQKSRSVDRPAEAPWFWSSWRPTSDRNHLLQLFSHPPPGGTAAAEQQHGGGTAGGREEGAHRLRLHHASAPGRPQRAQRRNTVRNSGWSADLPSVAL